MDYLNLPYPHGFLIWRGKQTAIASNELLDGNKFLIITDDDAFGEVTLGKPSAMTTDMFDRKNDSHCCKVYERKVRWPDAKSLFIYPIKSFKSFEEPLLFQDGKVSDYKPNANEQKMINQARELPAKIILDSEAVCVGDKGFDISELAQGESLNRILEAIYETEVSENNSDKSLPIYQLALVRNPKLIVKKKEIKEIKQMPWEIKEDFEDCSGFAVVKVSDDSIAGCHETVAEAEAQLTALNISEAEEEENAVHPDEDEDKRDEDEDEEDKADHNLEIIETFSIVDIIEDSEIPEMVSVHLTKEEAEEELKRLLESIEDEEEEIEEEVDKMSVEEKAGKRLNSKMLARLKDAMQFLKDLTNWGEYHDKQFLDDKKYGIAIKEVNGKPWIITWSSNAFEDRDKEIISTKALEQWSEKINDQESKGFFNLWHIEDSDFAKKEWTGVPGRILIEAGPFLENEKGQRALEFFKQHLEGHSEIAPEGWGCSIEFKFLPEERQTGVFENVEITRTSILPRFAAANIHTQIKEINMSMTDEQKNAALVVFGETLGASLLSGAESKSKELEQNIAHKDGAKKTQENFSLDQIVEAVAKQMNTDFEPIAEALAVMAEKQQEQDAKIEAMKKQEAVKEETEMPRFLFQAMRASDAGKTKIADDDDLTQRKPQETIREEESVAGSFFGGK